MARSLGITQLCIAVNKLDLIDWNEDRYDEICQTVLPYLKSIGYKEQNVNFVPCSGLNGINLESNENLPSSLTKWFNEENGKENKFKKPLSIV